MLSRWSRSVVMMLAVACSGAGLVYGQAAAPATEPAANAKATRDSQTIQMDLRQAMTDLRSTKWSVKDMFDVDKRPELQEKIVPKLKRVSSLMEELAVAEPTLTANLKRTLSSQILPMLAMMGDKDARATLETAAKSTKESEAKTAQTTLMLVSLVDTRKDAAAQNKVIDDIETFAKANPASDEVTSTLASAEMGNLGAGDEQKARLGKLLASMQSPMAKQYLAQKAEQAKSKEREGKPLAFSAKTREGKDFDSASLKGKVVLVDFWATWCGPCVAELPRVKDIYKKYHDQGFEIVGVSCDNSASDLTEFLGKNPEMTWVQLFDEKNAGWHPLAKEYGINAIPTMYLIDRKGVLRSVEARENMEDMIPKLLAEKVD